MNYIKVYRDNQAAIKMTITPINHSRTKRIDADYHQVREMVAEIGELKIKYIQTENMAADALTVVSKNIGAAPMR